MTALRAVGANIRREPALLGSLLSALLTVLVAFGIDVTPEQQDALLLLSGVLVAIGFGVRSQVTPSREVAAQELPDGEVVAGPAAPHPDGTPVAVEPAGAEPVSAPARYTGEHRRR